MKSIVKLGAIVSICLVGTVNAQDQVSQQYDKVIREHGQIAGLGSELFGDKIGLYTGALEFVQTDISLPGNNSLPVAISRRFVPGEYTYTPEPDTITRSFNDWDLDIPHIHGTVAYPDFWKSPRCPARPPAPIPSGSPGNTISPDVFWNGYFVYLPETGDQEILVTYPEYQGPTDGQVWSRVTKDGSVFSCFNLADGGADGFLLSTPDGKKYRFDHLVYRFNQSMHDSEGFFLVDRYEAWILPTQISDNFGNTVTYTWSGWELKSIVASDGRRLDITGLPIRSVTDGTRTWTYQYEGSPATALSKVILPDGSAWKFNLSTFFPRALASSHPCSYSPGNNQLSPSNKGNLYSPYQEKTGSMTHPGGAVAEFTVGPKIHGRSWIPFQCNGAGSDSYETEPRTFNQLDAIVRKKITGPGLAAEGNVWSYSYGPPNFCSTYPDSWVGPKGVLCDSSSPVTKEVQVTEPDGQVTRYIFGNKYLETEGKLLRVDSGWNGSTAKRSVVYTYRSRFAGPYKWSFGYVQSSRGDGALANSNSPVETTVIVQDGEQFVTRVNSFDTRARPTNVTKSAEPAP
jgi:hypothetical protein